MGLTGVRLTVLALCWFLFASLPGQTAYGAEPKRLVILETMRAPIVQQFVAAFLTRAAELEQAAGVELEVNRLNAEGSRNQAESLLEKALEKDPDLVLSVATMASQVAKKRLAVTDIPQLFMCVTDPVGAGLVREIGKDTNANITGKVHYISADTRVEMVKRIVGKSQTANPIRFGYIHTDYPSDLSDLGRLLTASAKRPDIEFVPYRIPYRELSRYEDQMLAELQKAILHLNSRVDYFWAPRGALAIRPGHDSTMIEHATKPFLVGATTGSVKKGAMLHITGDPISQGEQTADIAFEILQGRDPGKIPVSLPKTVQFAINLNTVKQVRLVIPPDLLELAGDNVYH